MPIPPFSGKFNYQSFYNSPIKVEDGALEGSPILAEPWTPLGTLDVLTDTVTGDVTGTLTFRPGVVLTVTGKVYSAVDPLPAFTELTGAGLGAEYRIKGWFIPTNEQIVGSVLSIGGDLARQAVGTVGPFVCFRKSG